MAIYHAHAKIFSRSSGVSILARASYRAGVMLSSQETGLSFDFSRKGGVVYSNILLPDNAPKDYFDREKLWNAVEAVETQSNAQLAREFECAIPREIPEAEREKFVTNFIQNTFVSNGMCADYSIHNPSKKEPNPHVHILLTMRPIKENGEWGEKFKNGYLLDEKGNKIPDIDENGKQKIGARGRKMWKRSKVPSTNWNEIETLNSWRKAWEFACNTMLAKEDHISCESNLSRGIDFLSTKHEGIEGKIRSEHQEPSLDRNKVKLNQQIKEYNQQLLLQATISQHDYSVEKYVDSYPFKFEETYPYEYESGNYRFSHLPRNEKSNDSELLFEMRERNVLQNVKFDNMSLYIPAINNVFSIYRSTKTRDPHKSTSNSMQQHTCTTSRGTEIDLRAISGSTVKFPKIRWLKIIPKFSLKFPNITWLKRKSKKYETSDVVLATIPPKAKNATATATATDLTQQHVESTKVYKFIMNGASCEASAEEIRENVDSGYFSIKEFENILSAEEFKEIFCKEDKKCEKTQEVHNGKLFRPLH